MNVLQVAPHFPPRSIGGVEVYVKRLADRLHRSGHSVSVVCVDDVSAGQPGVRAIEDTTTGYPVYRLQLPMTRHEAFATLYSSEAIERWMLDLLARTQPDVLHLHSGYLLGGSVLSAARQLGVPTVVTLHDYWFICSRITLVTPDGRRCSGPESAAKCAWCLATTRRRLRMPDAVTRGAIGRVAVEMLGHRHVAAIAGWSDSIARLAERKQHLLEALDQADAVLAPSRFLLDQMVAAGVPVHRIVMSRYGVVPDGQAVARPLRRDATLRLGYLGQLAPHKGVHVILSALQHFKSEALEVAIYGDLNAAPEYCASLRRLAQGDRRVTLCGAYQHKDVYGILAQLDAIVVPSLWYENAPFVIQEAQAAGVPVIASRLGGMQELVNDEVDGLLFEPGDALGLARQIGRLVADPAFVDRLRPNPQSVRTVDDEFRELSACYERLAGRR